MLPAPATRLPALVPAFFLALLIFSLTGCSVFKRAEDKQADKPLDGTQVMAGEQAAREAAKSETGDKKPGEAGTKRDAFSVEITGPKDVRDYLERHLDIQRYRKLDDLELPELSRLMAAAEPNARELLATLGYYTPTLKLELKDTPQGKVSDHEIAINVDPGPLTSVSDVRMTFAGPISEDTPATNRRRNAVTGAWSMPQGDTFTQSRWDNAKTASLRALNSRLYPLGRITDSSAQVDADKHSAALALNFDSGPAFKFGELQIRGSQRYDVDNARRIAQLPVGQDYDQQQLLDAQTRLASSGYYESVFMTLETEGTDPLKVPVVAQVREAEVQKLVFGVGYTTDSGPRVSIDHIHNKVPILGWRAVSKFSLDGKTQSIGTTLNGLLDDGGWRWFGSGSLQREESGSFEVNSGRLRFGRSRPSDHIDRSFFGQYDYANNVGTDAPPSASAVTANWAWTGRYFDNLTRPRRGYGLSLELGAGSTLVGGQYPLTRTAVRYLGLVPLYRVGATDGSETRTRRARLQVRAEGGAVVANDNAQIPATLNFLTGGDVTVRGFGYRAIGARIENDAVVAGRYMAVGSVELQHPVVYDGELSEFEAVAFVDSGAVADKPRELKAKVGTGVGMRWYSPVGLVQADIAHGFGEGGIRIHLRLGFTF